MSRSMSCERNPDRKEPFKNRASSSEVTTQQKVSWIGRQLLALSMESLGSANGGLRANGTRGQQGRFDIGSAIAFMPGCYLIFMPAHARLTILGDFSLVRMITGI